MFLFGDAHQNNFRESEGSVVAISNALARSSEGKEDVSLKVTEAASILKLGTSSDFALCGSRKRVRPHAHLCRMAASVNAAILRGLVIQCARSHLMRCFCACRMVPSAGTR